MYIVIAGKSVIECKTFLEAMEVYNVHTKTKSYKVRLLKVLEES
jgi:hypothetical protein